MARSRRVSRWLPRSQPVRSDPARFARAAGRPEHSPAPAGPRRLGGSSCWSLAPPWSLAHLVWPRVEFAGCSALRRRGRVPDRIEAWHVEALLRLERGDRPGAQRALRTGLGLLEGYRETLGASDLRASASEIGVELAELGLRIALAGTDTGSMLAWADRLRGERAALAAGHTSERSRAPGPGGRAASGERRDLAGRAGQARDSHAARSPGRTRGIDSPSLAACQRRGSRPEGAPPGPARAEQRAG